MGEGNTLRQVPVRIRTSCARVHVPRLGDLPIRSFIAFGLIQKTCRHFHADFDIQLFARMFLQQQDASWNSRTMDEALLTTRCIVQLTPTLVLMLQIVALAGPLTAEQIEELPPPKQEHSVLAGEPAVPRSSLIPAWSVIGPSGRHYCIGAIALADYEKGSLRHLVTLEADNPGNKLTPDEHFLYYRETTTGHRWAIARQASADQSYRVYFQAADRPGRWQLFQRAHAAWDQELIELAPTLHFSEPFYGDAVLCYQLLNSPY